MAQRYSVLREEQARDLSLGWPVLRQCARRVGDLLLATGAITAPDRVFFLTLAEVRDSQADHREQAERRRALWDQQRRPSAPITLGYRRV